MQDFSDFEMMEFPVEKRELNLSVAENIQTSDKVTVSKTIYDNMPRILDLAGSIVEIQKMKVASEAVLAKMEQDRLSLLAEAEVYAKKKNADTTDVVARFTLVRDMMRDFYAANTGNMTSEDFQKVITTIIEQMGK